MRTCGGGEGGGSGGEGGGEMNISFVTWKSSKK